MNESDWVVLGFVTVGIVAVPFLVLQIAKMISYGWASGRHRFDEEHKQKGDS